MRLADLPPHLRVQAERQLAGGAPVRSDPEPAKPKMKSPPVRIPSLRVPNATEARYNAERLGGAGLYEALVLRVPSGRYTPDWVWFGPDGGIVCVEVKGSYRLGSQSGASAKFKEAVDRFPGIAFVWAKLEKDGSWNELTIPPRAGKEGCS